MANVQTWSSAEIDAPRVPVIGSNGLRRLTSEEYLFWDRLVEASPQGSVFCYSWWLRALGRDVHVLGYFENGKLIAGIPLYFEKRFGLKLCCMPDRTVTWGVVMEPLSGKRTTVASREMEILTIFARHLTKHQVFIQFFHPSLQNWLPFLWSGFKQTTRFTYVLDDLTDPERIWADMRNTNRSEIRKAMRNGITVNTCDIETVFQLELNTLKRKLLKEPRTARGYLERLYDAAKEHSAAACFAAKDGRGRTHAASLIVWDLKSAYYLIGARDEETLTTGAQSLLIWHLIQFAAKRTKAFDFEGSQLPGVERYFRTFGPRLVGCNWVMKFPIWLKIYLAFLGKI